MYKQFNRRENLIINVTNNVKPQQSIIKQKQILLLQYYQLQQLQQMKQMKQIQQMKQMN